jgi:hypothetical protein
MAAPILAWGAANLYELPSGRHVWGREFELLPAGSMFAAGAILRGLIGVEAEQLDEKRCQIKDGAAVILYGMDATETRELDGYRDDVIEGFRQRQLQDSQG